MDNQYTVPEIPIIDFSVISLEHEDCPGPSDEAVLSLAKAVHRALSIVGFMYLMNHGIRSLQVSVLLLLHTAIGLT